MNQNELAKEIFGDSDVESELSEKIIESDNEEIKLPSFKKKPGAPVARRERKPKPEVVERPLSPESMKRKQAHDDVEQALKGIKQTGRKKDLVDEVQLDEISKELKEKMVSAALQDIEHNSAGKPAISKLRMLPQVSRLLQKESNYEFYIEHEILSAIKLWLEPLPDGSLPSLDIQKTLMAALDDLPCNVNNLRSSTVGHIINFYTKCDRVTAPIAKMATHLMMKWMRPILRRSASYKDKQIKQVRLEKERKPRQQLELSEDGQKRARIPEKIAPGFTVAPVNYVAQEGGEKKQDRYKKLKNAMRPKVKK
ncbi:hypothetical protein EDD86DRAFT_200157 [Gorgonomyces haynaldii]|nr:hypothetical protein EDD86DRAFT_200157 [Gorgonomyces haynaldii]